MMHNKWFKIASEPPTPVNTPEKKSLTLSKPEAKEAKLELSEFVLAEAPLPGPPTLNVPRLPMGRLGGKTKAVRKRRAAKAKLASLPPTLDAVITCRHTFGFQVITGFSALLNITGGNIAGAIGGYCTITNSRVTCAASSIKIHRVTVWPAQQNSPQNPPEIVWFSPITAMEKDASKYEVLPAGISVTAPVSTVPPRGTLCADWFSSVSGASQPVFGLANLAAGDVLHLDVSWTQSNNLLGVDRTVATGVLGTMYYLFLDGSTSHQIQPIGKPTTF